MNAKIPEDIYFQIAQFCDLSTLWAFGITCKQMANAVFKRKEVQGWLSKFRERFQILLRNQVKNESRIRLKNGCEAGENVWFSGGPRDPILVEESLGTPFGHFLMYPDLASMEGSNRTNKKNPTKLGLCFGEPVVHRFQDGTLGIIIMHNNRILRRIKCTHRSGQQEIKETRSQQPPNDNNMRIWSIQKVPVEPPILLADTSEGFFLYPNIFNGNFEKHRFANPHWGQAFVTSSRVCCWDLGLCTYLFAHERIEPANEILHLYHCKSNEVLRSMLLEFPRWTNTLIELVKYGERIFVVRTGFDGDVVKIQISSAERIFQTEQFPLIEERVIGHSTRDCVCSIISVDETMVAFTKSDLVYAWNLSLMEEAAVGPTKLIRNIRGPMKKALVCPGRGSIFLLHEGGKQSSILGEWDIGCAFV